MTTHIFDIDGTLVKWHTNEWLPGAKEMLINLWEGGHDIVLITMRGPQDNAKEWSMVRTQETIGKELDDLGIVYIILFDRSSPRILHDDNAISLDRRQTNQPW
jgi:FMN phosphatase YigB (HAD superfamily)